MRKLFIFFLFAYACFSKTLKAQDTLILNSGTEMYVKVIEIGENTISYKKRENLNGPTYTISLSGVFMAIYKGGKRETFKTTDSKDPAEIKPNTEVPVPGKNRLGNNTFEVRLIETKSIPDKKKKAIIINAMVEAYSNGQLFTKLSLNAYQRTDKVFDFTDAKKTTYWSNNYIEISALSENIKNILYSKYESYSGKVYMTALPPNFFSLNKGSCSVVLLEQNAAARELNNTGASASMKYSLQDCSTLENKLMSVALLWLNKNFLK